MKGAENDFLKTPRVRICRLKFSSDPVYDIVEDDYPIPRTKYKKLFFCPNEKLSFSAPSETSIVSYDSESYLDCAGFTYTFSKPTHLAGLPKAVLYMSTQDWNDMDLYVIIRKLDRSGRQLLNLNIPWSSIASQGAFPDKMEDIPERSKINLMFHSGSLGILRASRRAINTSRSLHENYPFHPHDRDDYITPGEIVKVEIGIWAMGVEYEEGESVRVEVHGNNPTLRGDFPAKNPFPQWSSKGRHNVQLGGRMASYVVLPFV